MTTRRGGKTGPKRESEKILYARGSALANRREPPPKDRPRRLAEALWVDPLPAAGECFNEKWVRLTKVLPNYDPWDHKGAYIFDSRRAQHAIRFVERCCQHIRGEKAGSPLRLVEWQKAIVANLFGWLQKGTEFRRYREALVYVPRKNNKTTLGASLALYCLSCAPPIEPGFEGYSAAGDREQARLAFELAQYMIFRCPSLDKRLKVYRSSIVRLDEHGREDGSSYKAISSEARTKHGFNSAFVLGDELHTHPTSELVDVLETSTGSRRNPLVVHITTSDYERESICNRKYAYARGVLNGTIPDETLLPVIYEASKDDDWRSVDVWRKANPMYGKSVKAAYLKAEARKAAHDPGAIQRFKQLHLNVRVSTTESWIPVEEWDECAVEDLDLADYTGETAYVGVDLSATRDLTSVVLLVPSDDRWVVFPFFFLPAERAELDQRTVGAPYQTWAEQGLIELTPGRTVDYNRPLSRISELANVFDIAEIVIDITFQALSVYRTLAEEGHAVVPMQQFGLQMAAPTKLTKEYIYGRKFAHDGHGVLRWNVSNAVAREDHGGNERITKGRSTGKIDGLVALVMAVSRAATFDGDVNPYDSRGILEL